jgi:hypothetical protein
VARESGVCVSFCFCGYGWLIGCFGIKITDSRDRTLDLHKSYSSHTMTTSSPNKITRSLQEEKILREKLLLELCMHNLLLTSN